MSNQSNNRSGNDNYLDFVTVVKGIIAIFLTIMVVAIVIILFAKSLFISEDSDSELVTGHLTETSYIETTTTTASEEVVSKETNKKNKDEDEDEDSGSSSDNVSLPDGLDTSDAGVYTCVSAVNIRSEASSGSGDSTVIGSIPTGASVTVYGSSNGWYYLEYDGTYGYSYKTYLSKAS